MPVVRFNHKQASMDQQCICSIRRVYRAISAFENDMEKAFGLNINEAMLLCMLSETEYPSSSEIAGRMGLSHSNTSKVIASLEKKGYVSRHICQEDKRSMHFNLTQKGKDQLEKLNCRQIQLPECLQKLSMF